MPFSWSDKVGPVPGAFAQRKLYVRVTTGGERETSAVEEDARHNLGYSIVTNTTDE